MNTFFHKRIFIKNNIFLMLFGLSCVVFMGFISDMTLAQENKTVKDVSGRMVTIPKDVARVICSGAGCLRLLTYLGAQDRIIAVDSIELSGSLIDARPYAIANPKFKTYPLFGEFRGQDNAELIASLRPAPQVIFKIFSGRGNDPDQLQKKTGIPVICLDYGNLTYDRARLNNALRLMGEVIDKTERAEAVIEYFDLLEQDLRERTQDIPEDKKPSCYIGGLGQSGPHGFQSTDPSFAPFIFTNTDNIAESVSSGKDLSYANVAKEQIVVWDPEIIFLDVATLRLGVRTNASHQLKTDPAYKNLSAVRNNKVYFLFPSNSYNQNFEVIIANAYYIGRVLYPERFKDVNPLLKAEEISTFLNGGPAFEILNREFSGLAFSRMKEG
jgi:iron complex transport system substrate-binding protein